MSNQIRIPAESIRAMRRSLSRELGPETAGRALQEAGYAAGDALFERLTGGGESDLRSTPSATFWDRLTGLFDDLGWGSMRHEEVHPGVGALVATRWFEADAEAAGASCPFTTGVLANLLGRVAGEEVAVMQVPCREDAGPCARFLFGAPSALDGLYSGLREGRDLDAALAALA
jgi:hypothetical protein